MNRNRMLIGALVAIIVGIMASRYVYVRLQQASSTVKPVAMDHVVVAGGPLEIGTRLDIQHLAMVDWPAGTEPAGTFTRMEDCVGRALITSVVQNQPIMEANLAPREAGAGLPAAIPEGMRAVSIRVDDVVGVAGFVMPGTMVDVQVTGDASSGGGGGGNTVTRTFLEDIRVLAAGQQVTQDQDGKPRTVNVVTVLVTPTQADKLTLASTQGRIKLVLRNTIDTKQTNPPPVYQSALFLGGAPVAVKHTKAAPKAPPPPPPYTIEVIHGTQTSTESFPGKP
ncbi:MAG TPA: Flp pilus assembly protein CpaB [Terriglobia bacterium]|nr:Flp pilus assembly protein CpaB [Terriglobia bacterium]